MNKNLFLITIGIFICLGFISANTDGTFVGNETETLKNISAEFDVVAEVQATQYYAEVWLNTSEINFGLVDAGDDNDAHRLRYKIRARGNVDIKVIPSLVEKEDDIFYNLDFARTFTSGWKNIGDYEMRFNLTKNKGYWSVIGTSTLENMTNSNGEQSIRLDLSNFNNTIPFNEIRRNAVKFVIVPDWNSVSEPSP